MVLNETRPIPGSVERRERAAGVEAVPAEPEDQAADRAQDDVVRRHRATAVALEDAAETRTEGDRAGQRDRAADGVHDGRAGEVVEAVGGAASHRDPRPSGR